MSKVIISIDQSERDSMAQCGYPIVMDKYVNDTPLGVRHKHLHDLEKKYHTFIGRSGNTWVVANTLDAAAHVYRTDNPANEKRKGVSDSSLGFSGRTLKFPLVDGSVYELNAGWHSSAHDLLKDTDVDLTKNYFTFGIIALDCEFIKNSYCNYTYHHVLHLDKGLVLGDFYRVRDLAQKISNKIQRKLTYWSESNGGSTNSFVEPA